MSEAPDLPTRVTRLEERMAEVHHLASHADRETSDVHVRLRAHTKSLEALRHTQLEQSQTQLEHTQTLLEHGRRLDRLETKMDDGFTKLALGQAQITALLNIALKNSDET
ncbi:MAG: hypothetical protein ACJ72N_17720 [Labedaea sp.]